MNAIEIKVTHVIKIDGAASQVLHELLSAVYAATAYRDAPTQEPEKEEKSEPEKRKPQKNSESVDADVVTELNALVRKHIRSEARDDIKSLIVSQGVTKISELSPEQAADLLTRVKSLLIKK